MSFVVRFWLEECDGSGELIFEVGAMLLYNHRNATFNIV